MNHEQIDQFNFIDRYLMGQLPEEENNGFEEHFVDCPQCVARLQTTRSFLQDLRYVAAEQTSKIDYQQSDAPYRGLPQTSSRNSMVWAVACLLIVITAVTIFAIGYTRHLQTAVNQAESRSEQWQRRYEDKLQAATLAETKHQETEAQQAKKLNELEAKLKDEEAQRAKMTARLNQPMALDDNVISVELSSVRGATGSAENGIEVSLSGSPTTLVFSIALEGERRFENYQVTILNEQGRAIVKNRSLTPNQNDVFLFSIQSSLFRSGRFSALLQGVEKGKRKDIGNYPFLIRKTR
jgi:hypothetical protein